jgi:hypothetical protein
MKAKAKKVVDKPAKDIIRASISFPIEDYEKLEQAAESKRVSLAWVVREAVREYLAGSSFSEDRK